MCDTLPKLKIVQKRNRLSLNNSKKEQAEEASENIIEREKVIRRYGRDDS